MCVLVGNDIFCPAVPFVYRIKAVFFPQHFLGDYIFKSKTLQDEFCPDGLCKAAMFALLVTEELESWPEQNTRQRSWLTVPKAKECCQYPWMQESLEGFSKWHADQVLSNSKEENPLILPDSTPTPVQN